MPTLEHQQVVGTDGIDMIFIDCTYKHYESMNLYIVFTF